MILYQPPSNGSGKSDVKMISKYRDSDSHDSELGRIVDWRIAPKSGQLEFYCEWTHCPNENTWESIDNVGSSENFIKYENKLVSQLDSIKLYKKSEIADLVDTFRQTFNAVLAERFIPGIKLLMPNEIIFTEEDDSTDPKVPDKIISELRTRYRIFTSSRATNYIDIDNEPKSMKKKALIYMLMKMMKTNDLTSFLEVDADYHAALEKSSTRLTRLCLKAQRDRVTVLFENNVDLQVLPKFKYTSQYVFATQPSSELFTRVSSSCSSGCPCMSDDSSIDCGCVYFAPEVKRSFRLQYKEGKVTSARGNILFECNDSCACVNSGCANRVTQAPPPRTLCIYRTETRGWALKTVETITKGSFVMKIVGDVISADQLIEGEQAHAQHSSHALPLYSDFISKCDTKVINFSEWANLSRFINSSCDPNLSVHFVYDGQFDSSLPQVALFARKNIKPGEELTYEYPTKYWSSNAGPIMCYCRAERCRVYLYS